MAYEKMTYVIYGLWEDDVCKFMAYEKRTYVIYGLWEEDVCNLWLMRRGRM